jgi:hypothetical protein
LRSMASSQFPQGTFQRPDMGRALSQSERAPTVQMLSRIPRGPSLLQNVVSRSNAAPSVPLPGILAERPTSVARSRPLSIQPQPSQTMVTPPRMRRSSGRYSHSMTGSPPGPSFLGSGNPARFNNIVLPLNDSVSQLASLSHSNHTLSPYARSHEHIAVRSFPYLSRSNSVAGTNYGFAHSVAIVPTTVGNLPNSNGYTHVLESGKTKATRKRLFRLREEDPQRDGEPTVPREQTLTSADRFDEAGCTPLYENRLASPRPVLASRGSYGFPTAGL